MKRSLCFAVLLVLFALLGAQTICNVRLSEALRYSGDVMTDAAGNHWALWEEHTQGRYRIFAQKYSSSGAVLFPTPVQIDLADVPVMLIDAVPSSDQGLLILYAFESSDDDVDMKLQKIGNQAQTLWPGGGSPVAMHIDIKQFRPVICANNLGGAFVMFTGNYDPAGVLVHGMNYNASGENIWTGPNVVTYPDVYAIQHTCLTQDGNLLFNLRGSQTQSFHQVDNAGNPIGPSPLFGPEAPIPSEAKMILATNGNILLYSDLPYYQDDITLQLLDDDLEPVYDTVTSIPLPAMGRGEIAKSLADGGFVISYFYADPATFDQYIIRTHRLDANLNQVWAEGSTDIQVNGDEVSSFHLMADHSSRIWLTATVVDDYYYNGQVFVAGLDSGGNIAFTHQVISGDAQLKYSSRLVTLGDSALLIWMEHKGEYKMMKRQIFDIQGNELLQQSGEMISSRLAGEAETIGVYKLGNKSISLWRDYRTGRTKVYYQILDGQLNQTMPDNGAELILPAGWVQLTSLKESNHNTLSFTYTGDNGEMYYQEIDDNGEQIYPDGGLLLADTDTSVGGTRLGFDGDDIYIFWAAENDNPFLTKKIKAQKVSGGAVLWENGGRDLYFHPYLHQIRVHDRFVAITIFDQETNTEQIRAFRIDTEGEIETGWGTDGVLLFTPDPEYLDSSIQSIVRLGDAYFCFSRFGTNMKYIRAQKVDATGVIQWDSAGLQIGNPGQYYNDIVSLQVNDHICFLAQQELVGAYLHVMDAGGNLRFGPSGLLMPGDGSMHLGARLVEHDNGAYSFFWIDHSNPIHVVKHAAINGSGTVQSIQEIASGTIHSIFTSYSEDNATLYWQQYHLDNLTFEESMPHSIFATSLPEPIATEDPVAEQIPPLSLRGNHPNPFGTSTTITYKLREEAPVELEIFNIRGQLVKRMRLSSKGAGEHQIDWDGYDNKGKRCVPGIYLYKLRTGKFSSSKKMILLK
ncbi:MAG: T9SS type A sorting domain-containing protein [Candidatus Cloacimonetes bacterium]|nr:T9SS type A sorting domain-containing protein [Candidatus Cloacimonadota bacterium]HPI25229.1 FlgD immunoglobulin-like domain containing protein [Candidatus Cloacimonadota bacterium]